MILLLNQFYPPDAAPTGRLAADLVRRLVAQGHRVTVVCGRSRYEPAKAALAVEPEAHPLVRIIRLPNLPFARNALARLLSYFSCFAGAMLYCLCARRPTVVLTLTTPPLLLPLVGTLLKKLRGGRHYIWEMDFYPDVMTDAGALQAGSWLARVLTAIGDYSHRQADGVVALGPCVRERLISHGLAPSKIHVAENWADGDLIRPGPPPSEGCFTVLYSGNLGVVHEFDTVCAAMTRLKADQRFRFVFAGAGHRRAALEEYCRINSIGNASFLPYQEPARLSDHLAACHVGLVTQNPACLGSIIPSKIYALMAAARPILFIGPRAATPARVIERYECGWHIDPGDVEALVALLHLLASDFGLAEAAGRRARQAFLEHYDLPIGVARLARILDLSGQAPESVPQALSSR